MPFKKKPTLKTKKKESNNPDVFFRRIEIQNDIIKKLVAEIDKPGKAEKVTIPDKKKVTFFK